MTESEAVCQCPVVVSLFTGEPNIFHRHNCPALPKPQVEFLRHLDEVNATLRIETKDGFELGGSH